MSNDQAISNNEICLKVQEIKVDEKNVNEIPPEGRPHNFEEVLAAMGPPGRYQILQCILSSANFLPVAFITMSFVFTGLEPPFSCSRINETTLQRQYNLSSEPKESFIISYENCDIEIRSSTSGRSDIAQKIGCNEGYSYKGGKHASIITEWDLVCGSRGIGEMVQTSMALGYLIGVVFASSLSDKFGRKKTLLVAIALCSVSELSSSFAPNIYAMISLRFFSGLFASGVCIITCVFSAELLVSKYREVFIFYYGVVWSLFSLLLTGTGYLFRNESWRRLQLCIGFCCMVPLLLTCFADESSSWLFSKGRFDQATLNLQRACRYNGLDFGKINDLWEALCVQEKKQQNMERVEGNYHFSDIFRNKKLRISSFIGWTAFLVSNISYTGLYLSASTLAGNLYLNTAFMALLDIPGSVLILVVMKYKGRRFVIMFFMAVAGVCLTVSTIIGSDIVTTKTRHISNTHTAFHFIARFASGNSYTTLYLYTPELFPTTLRSSGAGLCETGACVGMMVSPYLMPMRALVSWVPGACLVFLFAISLLLMLKLPETKGKQLSSFMEK